MKSQKEFHPILHEEPRPAANPMATIDDSSDARSDLEYAIHFIMTGKKDLRFAARVQAETESITEAIRRKHGILNVAVDLIRETRDEV